jgi:hypothetical protein
MNREGTNQTGLRGTQPGSDSQSSGRLPQVLRHPPTSGGPKKIERPESIPADRPVDADRPINHHVAGHQAVDPDKPGRPRNDHTHRHRGTPQPLAPDLDNGPGSDKQHCRPPPPRRPRQGVGRGPALAAQKSRPLTERAGGTVRTSAHLSSMACAALVPLLSPFSRCSRSPVERSRRVRPSVAEPTV